MTGAGARSEERGVLCRRGEGADISKGVTEAPFGSERGKLFGCCRKGGAKHLGEGFRGSWSSIDLFSFRPYVPVEHADTGTHSPEESGRYLEKA